MFGRKYQPSQSFSYPISLESRKHFFFQNILDRDENIPLIFLLGWGTQGILKLFSTDK